MMYRYMPEVHLLQMADVYGTEQALRTNLQGKILPGIRENIVNYQPGGGTRGRYCTGHRYCWRTEELTGSVSNVWYNAYQGAQAQRMPMANMILGPERTGSWWLPINHGRTITGMAGAVGDVGAERRAMTQED